MSKQDECNAALPSEAPAPVLSLNIHQDRYGEWAFEMRGAMCSGYRTAWSAAMGGIEVLLSTIQTEIEPEDNR